MTHDAAILKAGEIASRVLAPSAGQNDKAGRFSTEAVVSLGESGLLGLMLPVNVGGLALGPRTCAAVIATLAEADASVAMVYLGTARSRPRASLRRRTLSHELRQPGSSPDPRGRRTEALAHASRGWLRCFAAGCGEAGILRAAICQVGLRIIAGHKSRSAQVKQFLHYGRYRQVV